MRITAKDVRQAFGIFCKAHDFGEATASHGPENVGKYYLDSQGTGYMVHKVISTEGAVSQPFSRSRMTAREMYAALNFASEVAFERQCDRVVADHLNRHRQPIK